MRSFPIASFARLTWWPAVLLLGALLLPRPGLAQTYNNELVYTGPDDLYYEPGGFINDVLGKWTNQGLIVHDGPAAATFVNHGTYTSYNGGTDRFTALTSQIELAGTRQPTFYDVEFLNAGEVELTNTQGARVTNAATLRNTLVDNVAVGVAGALRFGPAGTYAWQTGPDDAHHVNGYVGKDGPDPFLYPVGSGTDYRYLRTAAPNGMAVAFLASNPQGTTSFGATISKVFPTATWPIDAVAVGSSVTVSMPAISVEFAVANRLRLVGWTGTQWIDLSGLPTATGADEGSELTGTLLAGIQAVGIGASVDPLPVTLSRFTAKAVKADAVLSWATASEKRCAYFQIERATDARADFVAVGARVPGAGTSAAPHTYALTDAGVGRAGGTFYYRLRQVDDDGVATLSDVRALTFGAPTAWAVAAWPNPFARALTVQVTATAAGPALVQVFDATGRLVREQTPTLPVGTTPVALEGATTLPLGAYVLRVSQGAEHTTIRLVRQ